MRTRQGFVSNSSSSSFIIVTNSENIHPDVVGDVTWYDEDRVRTEIKEIYEWDVIDRWHQKWHDENPTAHHHDMPDMINRLRGMPEEEQWKLILNEPEARDLYDHMMDALDAGDFVAEVEIDYSEEIEPLLEHHEVIKDWQ